MIATELAPYKITQAWSRTSYTSDFIEYKPAFYVQKEYTSKTIRVSMNEGFELIKCGHLKPSEALREWLDENEYSDVKCLNDVS